MLNIESHLTENMVSHALADYPNECCGILAGSENRASEIYRMDNVEASPYRYSMNPKEFLKALTEIEDRGLEIIAIYHSHTHSEAYPSATDVRLVTWPEARYILVSLLDKDNPSIRAFLIEETEITEETIELTN